MIYNIYPTKDTTIYSYSASANFGLDPVLEIEKTLPIPSSPSIKNEARTLIKFDWDKASTELNALPGAFATKLSSNNFSANIIIHSTAAENIPYSYKLEALRLDADWEMGLGKKINTPPTQKGVSWGFKDQSGSSDWSTQGGSIQTTHANVQTQSFEFESTDIKINVSESIAIISDDQSGVEDYGYVIRFSSSLAADNLDYGTLKFFSSDSNTIYSPKLQFGWDDSAYSTGSLSAADTDEIMVYLKNNKYEYQEKEVIRFQVRARDVFPTQTYSTTSAALDVKYLPTGSYYSIKDAETEESVINFDHLYTKVSCTSSGNYFDIAMNALTPERLYKVVLKVEDRTYGSQVEIFDSNHIFKVVR
tara:strand:+ start:20798 stop:21883 length:1086 start_codon:yes stop_codon:yes gene_type:complete